MSKLFAVSLGGRAEGCNIELHDIVFGVGESLEKIYPNLINKWFGITKRLHIDSSIELRYVDGHAISLSLESPSEESGKNLYFVNFGAYRPDYFGEIHQTAFYVASSKNEALQRAKQDLCLDLSERHCDDNHAVDDLIVLSAVDNYFIHLKETTVVEKLAINSTYRKLEHLAVS